MTSGLVTGGHCFLHRPLLCVLSRSEGRQYGSEPVRAWRLGVLLLLVSLVGFPLAMPVFALIRSPEALSVLLDISRLWILARNTVLLILGTLAIALPPGVALAILLYRT